LGAEDAGAASATVNTSQQIGGSIGTALLNTVATSVTSDYIATHVPNAAALRAKAGHSGGPIPPVVKDGLVEGFTHAYTVASAILLAAAVVVSVLMNTPCPSRAKDTSRAAAAAVHLG
jgi:hypothetical protein